MSDYGQSFKAEHFRSACGLGTETMEIQVTEHFTWALSESPMEQS
jgi:hypothetical protein